MVWAYVSGFGSQIDEIVLKFPLAGAIDKVFFIYIILSKNFTKKVTNLHYLRATL